MDNSANSVKHTEQTTFALMTDLAPKAEMVRSYQEGVFCPNCSGKLTGRKCKLFCETPGCGYLVTCSEF